MARLIEELGDEVRALFWDVDAKSVDLGAHADFVMGRVLSKGSLEAVGALRRALGDEALRDFIRRAPHRLDPRSRRFFEVVLGVSAEPCTTKQFRQSSERLFRA